MGTWETREGPILTAVGEADADGDSVENLDEIIRRTGLSRKQAAAGVLALVEGDYITGDGARTFGDYEWMELRLLPAGREAYGSWPRPDDPLEALLRVIAEQRDTVADPATRGKLDRLYAAATDVGRQIIAEVVGGLVVRGM